MPSPLQALLRLPEALRFFPIIYEALPKARRHQPARTASKSARAFARDEPVASGATTQAARSRAFPKQILQPRTPLMLFAWCRLSLPALHVRWHTAHSVCRRILGTHLRMLLAACDLLLVTALPTFALFPDAIEIPICPTLRGCARSLLGLLRKYSLCDSKDLFPEYDGLLQLVCQRAALLQLALQTQTRSKSHSGTLHERGDSAWRGVALT
jgi:hypothetical protein